MVRNTLHRKLNVEQHQPTNNLKMYEVMWDFDEKDENQNKNTTPSGQLQILIRKSWEQ